MSRLFWRGVLLGGIALHLGQWRLLRDRENADCLAHPRAASPDSALPGEAFRCRFPARNPGVLADGRLAFVPLRAERDREKASGPAREWARGALRRELAAYPALLGLSEAVWLGDAEALGEELHLLYRRAGVLHVLALSGQHVASLWFFFQLIFWVLAPWANRSRLGRRAFHLGRVFFPLLAAGVLAALNPFNEPILRAAALLGLLAALRARGFIVGGLQLACSTAAVLFLLCPEKVASDSFCLSAVATIFLCGWVRWEDPRAWVQYLTLNFALPVLLFPVTAFFFGKVSLLAPLHGLWIGALWTVFWVPLGFGAPFLPAVLLPAAEKSWEFFLQIQAAVAPALGWGYWSVPRLTWVEWIAWESWVILVICGCRAAFRRAAPATF